MSKDTPEAHKIGPQAHNIGQPANKFGPVSQVFAKGLQYHIEVQRLEKWYTAMHFQ